VLGKRAADLRGGAAVAEPSGDDIRELERVRAALASLAERGRALDPRDCDPSRVCHVISGG
jgi:hypothetical protein